MATPTWDTDEQDVDIDERSPEDFARSRRFNRLLAALGIFLILGLGGAGYYYFTQNQETTIGATTESVPADEVSTSPTTQESVAPPALTGSDPVAFVTAAGTVSIATASENLEGAANLASSQIATPVKFIGMAESLAFIVDGNGTAWRADFRSGEPPINFVELGTPTATTQFQFLGLPDGRIYFTDSKGALWTVDSANQPGAVYTPESVDLGVVDLAANATELYILTANGDVRVHQHGGAESSVGFGPSSEKPAVVSISATDTGAIMTAAGGTVRIADPNADPNIGVLFKRQADDQAIAAVPAAAGGVVLTEKGNVFYAVRDEADSVALYSSDGAPAVVAIAGAANGAVGGLDADGSLWLFDIAGGDPVMLWDAATSGKAAEVQPNENGFSVLDATGNVWSVPSSPGGQQIQLTDTGGAASIVTAFHAPASK